MSEFEKIRIKELGKIVTGNTPVSTDETNYGGKYPFIKPTDMTIDQKHVFEYDETYSEKSYQRFKRSYIPKGATGVVTIGTVGEKMFQAHEDCFTNQSVNCIISDDKYFDKDYIFYLMKFNLSKVAGANPGTASGRHHVSKSNFSSIKVDVTKDLSTQKKIAKILSNYDDLIENNLKRIKLLEESARLTYEEWFLRFRIDGEKLEIDSGTGLPFGWDRKTISSIASINSHSINVKTAPDQIQYIDISSTETGFHNESELIDFKDAPSRARRKVKYGDTIFSTVRPNRKTYSLILEDNSRLIVSTGFAVVTPEEKIHFPFIYLSLSNQSFIDSAVAVAGGAAYPAINQTDFEKLEVIVPTKEILNYFCDLTTSIFIIKSNLLQQNKLLKEARDILLPRLMTGMIDVDELEVVQYEL